MGVNSKAKLPASTRGSFWPSGPVGNGVLTCAHDPHTRPACFRLVEAETTCRDRQGRPQTRTQSAYPPWWPLLLQSLPSTAKCQHLLRNILSWSLETSAGQIPTLEPSISSLTVPVHEVSPSKWPSPPCIWSCLGCLLYWNTVPSPPLSHPHFDIFQMSGSAAGVPESLLHKGLPATHCSLSLSTNPEPGCFLWHPLATLHYEALRALRRPGRSLCPSQRPGWNKCLQTCWLLPLSKYMGSL